MRTFRCGSVLAVALVVAGCVSVSGGRPELGRARCYDDSPRGGPDPGARSLFYIFCLQSP